MKILSVDAHSDVIYGRRRGRRLRPGREQLLHDILPKVEVTLSDVSSTPTSLFESSVHDLWLEIGFGSGEHLAAQAVTHPKVGIIGCEPYRNGVAALLARIKGNDLKNIKIYPDDARVLLNALPSCSIGRAFVLFPDPWPKARHHRRRIINSELLLTLAHILKPGGELRLASDNMEYVRRMLYCTLDHGGYEWLARRPEDWCQRPTDWPPTRYEMKAHERGAPCVFLHFRRLST